MANGTWGQGGDGTVPLKVILQWSQLGAVMQTGFHLRRDAAALATLDDVVTNVSTALLLPFRNCLLTSDQVRSIQVIDMVTKEGAESTPANVFGTVAQAATPAFLMVPISFKSGIRKRIGQGRMLFPVRSEEFTTGDVLSAPGVTVTDAFSQALRTNYVTGGVGQEFQLINAHGPLSADRPHKRPTPLPAVPAEWYDVVSIRTGTVLSAVRSRRLGVGG